VVDEDAAFGHHLLDVARRLNGYAAYHRTHTSITSIG
jgi:hypothetical protein